MINICIQTKNDKSSKAVKFQKIKLQWAPLNGVTVNGIIRLFWDQIEPDFPVPKKLFGT
jgi:hypothetical protein